MTTTTETELKTPASPRQLVTYGVLSAIAACIVNAFVRIVAVSLFGVPTGFEPLGWGPIVNTTAVAVVGATAAYGILTRVSQHPDRVFLKAAFVVLVLSFVPLVAPPAFLAEAPVSVLLTLAVMHVTTAAVAVDLPRRVRIPGVRTR